MPKEEAIQVEATVVEPLPNAMFRLEFENKHRLPLQVDDTAGAKQ